MNFFNHLASVNFTGPTPLMIFIVLSGFIVAFLQFFTGKFLRDRYSVLYAVLPALLFIYFLSLLPVVIREEAVNFHYPWIPSWQLDLDFRLDGLSLLFCLLITGIGTLVFLYASAYMKKQAQNDRFFAFLSVFMGSMLGLVLSDDVMSMFCFWELTSISSYFLIGYKTEDPAARKSAFTALAVTGGGGALLLAGLVLMANVTGSYSIEQMIATKEIFQNHQLSVWMILLLLAGAFTKSAQFPFHFWLPAAMKAPSPVSAYLHSATMVKAGIYIIARFTPVFGGDEVWNSTLIVTGSVTMLYAAAHAIFRTDLKSILAYSTVSALGLLVFLLGINTTESLIAAAVFIVVHALYKAALFLVAGSVEHATGTRDITELSGLRKSLAVLAIAGLFAALSSGGIPLTLGFVGKDLIYDSILKSGYSSVLLFVAIATNILLFLAGFLAGLKPFSGTTRNANSIKESPAFFLWFSPMILSVAGLLFGVFPGLLNTFIQTVSISIFRQAVTVELSIWHGFNMVLLYSALTLLAGTLLYLFYKPSKEKQEKLNRFSIISPGYLFQRFGEGVERFSAFYTASLKTGYLRFYLFTIIIFLTGILSYKVLNTLTIDVDVSSLMTVTFYEATVFVLMMAAILITITTASRLKAVAALGVVGLCICLIFVFYSAPDLAMTQFAIDTLTVVLFVLVLFKLPPFLRYTNLPSKLRDAALSITFGFLIAAIALVVLQTDVHKDVSDFYIQNSYTLAKGKNIVNVILVDFRGADTLIEISVLVVAAVGVYSLLKLEVNPKEKE